MTDSSFIWEFTPDAAVCSPAVEAAAAVKLLQQDGLASLDENRLSVPHAVLANMEPWALAEADLPPAAPFRLEIQGRGPITSDAFTIHWALRDGRNRVLGSVIQGAIVTVRDRRYTLLNPLFEIVEALRAFSAPHSADMDTRMAAWASIKALLPEDAIVDDQLRLTNFVRADGFTLSTLPDGSFDPVPLSRPLTRSGVDDLQGAPEEPLPTAYQQKFAERFRSRPEVGGHYSVGPGWYVSVPENTRRALSVVHRKQRAPKEEREAFLANPQRYVREALGDDVGEEALEAVFVETPEFLSDRIECLGVWQPKLAAYVQEGATKWFPDEGVFPEDAEVGVQLDGAFLRFPMADAPALLSRMEDAQSQGLDATEWNGVRVPVSEETIGRVAQIARSARGTQSKTPGEELPASQDKLVPVVIDNLEDLGYVAKRRATHSVTGGLPDCLATRTLYQHQQLGLTWLQEAWMAGHAGVLLADDMGLGKTLQALAFLGWLKEEMQRGSLTTKPMLIVAPTGLLKTWEKEADTHLVTPGLGRLLRAYGGGLKELSGLGSRQRLQRVKDHDWVMTTYETLRDRIEVFLPVDWGALVFDEAQKAKNPGSRLTEMAKSLQADFTITLTGTPVENRLTDLWSIVDLCRPGFLGALSQFRTEYEGRSAQDVEQDKSQRLKERLENEGAPPLLLRRMKEDHLDGLPEKKMYRYEQSMGQEQASAYSAVIAEARGASGRKGAILEALQKLRRVSLLGRGLGGVGLTDEVVQSSARMSAMCAILDEVKARHEKALIFVEYLDVQDALSTYLAERFSLDALPPRINGKVAGPIRQRHVDAFQALPEKQFAVMILSPRAGGVGLTLTAANHVIHLSRWWNPAVEDQCTDRIYRIGQNRPVNVHYPLAIHPEHDRGSFDLNLDHLLERKRELSASVLAPPDVSEAELLGLLNDSTK